MSDLMMIHKKIKQLRIDRNLTQLQACKGLNMSQNAYSLMETGKSKIDHQKIINIANFYKVSPLELLDEETINILKNHNAFPDIDTQKIIADTLELSKYLKEVIIAFDKRSENLINQQIKILKETIKYSKSINNN